jgi:transcriptional regulator with XRE-family HTH domain
MTQDDLGQALGLTRASIANLEAGRQRVPVHTLVAASVALALPVEQLIPREAPQGSIRPKGIPRSTPQQHLDLVHKLVGNADRTREG